MKLSKMLIIGVAVMLPLFMPSEIQGNKVPPVITAYTDPTIEQPVPTWKYTFQNMGVPVNRNAFAYMNYISITSRGSKQWQVRQNSYTDMYGIRCQGAYYLVAMGTYYGKVGDKFKIHTASGGWYMVMLGDVKSDAHTDANNQLCGTNGSLIEFIVDPSVIKNSTQFNKATSHLKDTVVKIEKIIDIRYEL